MYNQPQGNEHMLAYHSKPELKANTIAAMEADIAAERLQPGHYWNGKTGCFVGCVIRGNEHSKFEDVLGIPRLLARLGDGIYEGLNDTALRQKFAVDFLAAISPGVDLSMVFYHFMHWLLLDKADGVIKYAKNEKTKEVINKIGSLYANHIAGKKVSAKSWQDAAADADADAAAAYADADAADAAAAAAADAAAAYAAAAAAYAADAAAAYAAADAAAAARKQSRIKQAAKLIELLKEA